MFGTATCHRSLPSVGVSAAKVICPFVGATAKSQTPSGDEVRGVATGSAALSDKDRRAPRLRDLTSPFRYEA